MFTTIFKMTDHPFPGHLPTEALQRDQRFTEALARLQFFAEFERSAIVTGDEGVGKSSLVRLFMQTLTENRLLPIYLHLTHVKAPAFLKLLVHALGEKPAQTKDQVLIQIITKLGSLDRTTVCIVDEAHLLHQDSLVDLRLLLSDTTDSSERLKLLLVGHSQLKKHLNRSCHTALAQRTVVRYHLMPFSPAQTADYINFHLSRVGTNAKLFDEDVKHEIHEQARGIPRLINNLATACLITAATLNNNKITHEILSQTLAEFQLYL